MIDNKDRTPERCPRFANGLPRCTYVLPCKGSGCIHNVDAAKVWDLLAAARKEAEEWQIKWRSAIADAKYHEARQREWKEKLAEREAPDRQPECSGCEVGEILGILGTHNGETPVEAARRVRSELEALKGQLEETNALHRETVKNYNEQEDEIKELERIRTLLFLEEEDSIEDRIVEIVNELNTVRKELLDADYKKLDEESSKILHDNLFELYVTEED